MHINQVHEHSPLYEWYRILFPSQQCPIRKEDQLRNLSLSKGKKSTSESSKSGTYISQTTQYAMIENFNYITAQSKMHSYNFRLPLAKDSICFSTLFFQSVVMIFETIKQINTSLR